MWYIVSSPAMPTVCLEQKPENFQSHNVTFVIYGFIKTMQAEEMQNYKNISIFER